MEKANADEIKKQNDELKAKYGTVKINGNDEPLASWTIEPEGIFFGRGDSPLNGYWKFENTAADIKLNTNSKNLPEVLFYGEDGEMLITSNFAWNVAWNPESHFAAQYNINIGIPNADGSIKTLKSTKYKMIQFAAHIDFSEYVKDPKNRSTAQIPVAGLKMTDIRLLRIEVVTHQAPGDWMYSPTSIVGIKKISMIYDKAVTPEAYERGKEADEVFGIDANETLKNTTKRQIEIYLRQDAYNKSLMATEGNETKE